MVSRALVVQQILRNWGPFRYQLLVVLACTDKVSCAAWDQLLAATLALSAGAHQEGVGPHSRLCQRRSFGAEGGGRQEGGGW